MKNIIKIPDFLIILIAAGLTIFSAYAAYIKPQGQSQILIRGQNDEWVYQIDADETIVVMGPIGNTVVRIQGKCAWVESSDCDNQTCVAVGLLTEQGRWAACLPNKVLVMIRGAGDDDIDAISR